MTVGKGGQDRAFPLSEAIGFIRSKISQAPEVFLVLGSGLSGLAEGMPDSQEIPFSDVPGFPNVGVAGHAGRLVSGTLAGRKVLLQAGRFHFYEGHAADVVVAPVRIAAGLGAQTVILTNAAGGIAEELVPGSIMLLNDHLNLLGRSPLAGPVVGDEERFPDTRAAYDEECRKLALSLAGELGVSLNQGTYAACLGPSYETPAEVRFLEKAGADAVGMSTVPEVIAARALGLRVVAFSLVTNRAAGLGNVTLDHEEVLEVGKSAGGKLKELILALLKDLPD